MYWTVAWKRHQVAQWIFVNVASFAIATVVALAISAGSVSDGLGFVIPLMGLIVNSIVGIAQDVLIYRHVGQPYWGRWLLATSVGGGLGWLGAVFGGGLLMKGFGNLSLWNGLPPQIPAGLMILWLGLVMGAGTGLAQLFLLRKHLARPGHWLRASMAGRGLGWVAAVAIAASLHQMDWLDLEFSKSAPLTLVITGLLVGSVIGLVYGWFTSQVLQQLWQTTPAKSAVQ